MSKMRFLDATHLPTRRLKSKRNPLFSLLALICTLASVAIPVLSFRPKNCAQTTLAFHSTHTSKRIASGDTSNRVADGTTKHYRWRLTESKATLSSSPGFILSMSSSPSMESDISSNIEELELLRRERQSKASSDVQEDRPSMSSPNSWVDENQQPHLVQSTTSSQANNRRPTLKSILKKPVGALTTTNLNSLCNSSRHIRKGSSFNSLRVLERILSELDQWQYSGQQQPTKPYLKRIHIFSMLTALSKDIQAWKQKQLRNDKNKRLTNHNASKSSHGEKIGARDIQRLTQVVTLLSQLRHSHFVDSGCYTKDVPSFATMIAAEASRWETTGTAIEAALMFLDMVEKEESGDEDWDPRLVGAVLDALARDGRAEEAQALLGSAMGVEIPNIADDGESADMDFDLSTTKRLDPSRAGPCYDALLRAWSKKALLLAKVEPDIPSKKYQKGKRKPPPSNVKLSAAKSSLAQARHILLNHMPLQSGLTITNKTCSAVLQGYSVLGMGMECESMLMQLEALHLSPLYSRSSLLASSSSTFPASLDVACYNSVLHAYSQSQDLDDDLRAERLFLCMKDQSELDISVKKSTDDNGNLSSSLPSVIPPQPDFISYSSMVNCYSKHGMVSKAEGLLDEMNEKGFVPNGACYLPIIQALEKSEEVDAPDRVISLIERSELSLSRPSRLLYTAALRCMRRHGCGDHAERILEKYHNAFPNRGHPDVYSYILVLRAWEKTKPKADRQFAARRAEAFFEEMEKKSRESFLPALDVNVVYNILLNCYARAGEGDRAEQLLARLLEKGSDDNHEQLAKPNSKSYSLVIKAWAKSNSEDSVIRAWQILYRLGYPRDTGSKLPLQKSIPFKVSIDNFNSMLKLYAKRGMAAEAEALLCKMDELVVEGTLQQGGPDMKSYEAVLEALGRCKEVDAPSRAEALVTRLEVMSELGGDFERPSLLVYNTLLNCYANAGMAGKAERLLERLNGADSFSYGSTIKAITNSGKSQLVSISRAESLAKTLGTGNEVISAHRLKLAAKWGLGQEAEQLIQQMEDQDLPPSVIHYTAAINAWAKSTDDDAMRRAETLFKTMEEKVDLDLAAYHSLLINYSTRGEAKKARRLLQTILDSTLTPNRNTFTMVMDAYARKSLPNAGEKAAELLDQMRELHAAANRDVEPDDITYASVIRCKATAMNRKIRDLTPFEKIQLCRELQLETWPFDRTDDKI